VRDLQQLKLLIALVPAQHESAAVEIVIATAHHDRHLVGVDRFASVILIRLGDDAEGVVVERGVVHPRHEHRLRGVGGFEHRDHHILQLASRRRLKLRAALHPPRIFFRRHGNDDGSRRPLDAHALGSIVGKKLRLRLDDVNGVALLRVIALAAELPR
jgi:hypothetical protein